MNLDVIVITRGGGSLEDLYGFSSEIVVEAIHDCKTCVISAIGHEIDFMLSDFVADIRAPTPSIAGEIISSSSQTLFDKILFDKVCDKLTNILNKSLNKFKYDVMSIKLQNPISIIDSYENKFMKKVHYLSEIVNKRINNYNNLLNDIMQISLLQSQLQPQLPQTPQIPYISYTPSESVEQFISSVHLSKKLKLVFKDGDALCTISNITINR